MDNKVTPHPAEAAVVPWRWPEEFETSIPARFELVVASHPTSVAVITDSNSLTYEELNQAANRLAHGLLAERGAPLVEGVGFLLEHGAAQLVAMLGILKAGGYYVPLDLALPEAINRDILNETQVRLIVTDDERLGMAKILAPAGARIINLSSLRPGLPVTSPNLPISPDQLATLHYTSGSTGKPKSVMQNHRNILHFMAVLEAGWRFSRADRFVHLISCSFSAALVPTFGPLLNGASLAPCDPRQVGIAGLYDWLKKKRITVYFSVPTICRRLVDRMQQAGVGLPDLKLVVMGGEPLLTTDIESFRRTFPDDCRLINIYAGAEMHYACQYALDKDLPLTGLTTPIGYEVEGKEIMLLDEERRLAGPGEVGEIAVRSRYLTPGYLNQPDLTAKVLLPDPDGGDRRIYLTGDLARRNDDGCLVHMGRSNTMIKISGQRVELGAVEHALRTCSGVSEATITVCEDARGEKTLAAYVVRQPTSDVMAEVLRTALRERLPEVMVPKYMVFMNALPVTTGGKINREALPPPSRTRSDIATPFIAPRNGLEQQIADIWAELLELDAIGVEDNFFDLGGDSLHVLRMTVAVEEALGRSIPPSSFLSAPTVAKLAQVLAENHEAPGAVPKNASLRQAFRLDHGPARSFRLVLRSLRQRLRFRIVEAGPEWRGHGWPHGLGIYLLRLLIKQKWVRRRFEKQLEPVRRWTKVIGAEANAEEAITISLLANLWSLWRARALSRPEALGSWLMVNDPDGHLRGASSGAGGTVVAIPHAGHIVDPLRRICERNGRETATVTNIERFHATGDVRKDAKRHLIARTEMLLHAKQVLRRGGVVFIPADGFEGKQFVEVPFWGQRRPFQIGAAELAVSTGAMLVPAHSRLDVQGRVWVEVTKPLTTTADTVQARIAELTRQYGEELAERWPWLYASIRWNNLDVQSESATAATLRLAGQPGDYDAMPVQSIYRNL